MKKTLLIAFTLFSSAVFAQDSLLTLNNNRNHIKSTGMEVLATWGAANLATGIVGYYTTNGQTKYFHAMNGIFGAVNLGVAILGYANTSGDKNKTLTPVESLRAQRKIENIFLINGGLDLVYIGSGFYLKHRGNEHDNNKLQGYGSGLILQGIFLLLFDATMYNAEKHNGTKLRNFLQKNPITFNGQRLGMSLKF